MFDVGFTEIVLISVVALLVLGPDKLPGAIRTLGLWIGRLRRSFNNIKADIEREVGADEIRRQLRNEAIMDKLKNTKSQFTESIDSVKKQADSVKKDLSLENELSSGKKQQDTPSPESVQTDKGQQPEGQQNLGPGSEVNPAGANATGEPPAGGDSGTSQDPRAASSDGSSQTSGSANPASPQPAPSTPSAEPPPASPAGKAEAEPAPAATPGSTGKNPPARESKGSEPQKPSEQK